MASLENWARGIKRDTLALYLATRDPRTPWQAKALGIVVVAYALSPIDLIPDFIPVLGYLDDLILLPLGIWAAVKFIPAPIMEDHRARRNARRAARQSGRCYRGCVRLAAGRHLVGSADLGRRSAHVAAANASQSQKGLTRPQLRGNRNGSGGEQGRVPPKT